VIYALLFQIILIFINQINIVNISYVFRLSIPTILDLIGGNVFVCLKIKLLKGCVNIDLAFINLEDDFFTVFGRFLNPATSGIMFFLQYNNLMLKLSLRSLSES